MLLSVLCVIHVLASIAHFHSILIYLIFLFCLCSLWRFSFPTDISISTVSRSNIKTYDSSKVRYLTCLPVVAWCILARSFHFFLIRYVTDFLWSVVFLVSPTNSFLHFFWCFFFRIGLESLRIGIGPNPYTNSSDEDFQTNPFSRLVIIVFIVVGATMLLINVLLIACFIKRRSKKRLTAGET